MRGSIISCRRCRVVGRAFGRGAKCCVDRLRPPTGLDRQEHEAKLICPSGRRNHVKAPHFRRGKLPLSPVNDGSCFSGFHLPRLRFWPQPGRSIAHSSGVDPSNPVPGSAIIALTQPGHRSQPFLFFPEIFLRNFPARIRCSRSILIRARVLLLIAPVANISFIGVQYVSIQPR